MVWHRCRTQCLGHVLSMELCAHRRDLSGGRKAMADSSSLFSRRFGCIRRMARCLPCVDRSWTWDARRASGLGSTEPFPRSIRNAVLRPGHDPDRGTVGAGVSGRSVRSLIAILLVTPAWSHTGEPLQLHDFVVWSFDPLIVAGLGLAAWAYAKGLRRTKGIRHWEIVCYWIGWIALAAALISPLH